MALDFPSSPVADQVFSPPGVPGTYIYQSGAWRKGPKGTADRKNRLVNPAMQVNQLNVDVAGADIAGANVTNYYMADQWQCVTASSGVTATTQSRIFENGKYKLQYNVTTGGTITATKYMQFTQKIEGFRVADLNWGTAAAQPVVFRFSFSGPAGTYTIGVQDIVAATRSWVENFTVRADQANQDLEFQFYIPGCPDGTWATDTAIGMLVFVTLFLNSAAVTPAGAWAAGLFHGVAVSSIVPVGTWKLWDVGLYADPNKTGRAPEFETGRYDDDLEECQRYFYRAYGARGVVQSATTQWYAHVSNQNPTPMRIPPVFILSTPKPEMFDGTTAAQPLSSIGSVVNSKLNTQGNYIVSNATNVIGRLGIFQYTADDAYVGVDARM